MIEQLIELNCKVCMFQPPEEAWLNALNLGKDVRIVSIVSIVSIIIIIIITIVIYLR